MQTQDRKHMEKIRKKFYVTNNYNLSKQKCRNQTSVKLLQ